MVEGWPSRARLEALSLGGAARVPAEAIVERVTTSGGPGGQHANRSRTRVSLSVAWVDVEGISPDARARALARTGPAVRAASSRFRSQGQNREAARERLVARLRAALAQDAPRRATRPTRGAVERRLEEKRATARRKGERRPPAEGD